MGTSKSRSTPSGGGWTSLKTDITHYLNGDTQVTPLQIIGKTIAAGGTFSSGGSGSSYQRTGGRAGGGGGGKSKTTGGLGRTISGLGGFASTLQTGGLDAALKFLSLDALQGKSAPEIVSRIAEHLSESADGLDREILTDSIRNAIIEAAALGDEMGYEDLEAGLQGFIDTEGIEGLIELMLGTFAFEYVWNSDEQHIQDRSSSDTDIEAMQTAFQHACRSEVRTFIAEMKEKNRFDKVDWFGQDGARFGRDIAVSLESRLTAYH